MNDPAERVREAMAGSELLAGLRAAGGPAPADARPLTGAEIAALEAGGSRAEDWSRVRVTSGFDPRHIVRAAFVGDVVIGRTGVPVDIGGGVSIPSGICDSTVSGCVVCDGALIRDVSLLHNAWVGGGAVLMRCGRVWSAPGRVFCVGMEIPVGIETGGREVAVYPELTVEVAAEIARNRGARETIAAYVRAVREYAGAVRAASARMYIGTGARVVSAGRVENSFVGDFAIVDGAARVSDSILLSGREEPALVTDGALVESSVVQWGASVESGAIVSRSVMCEHSHAERMGKVADSIIGPNTGVAQGEVTASLVGPFVGFHHQALLIATIWPEGKGNVAHGADVGSNHPSRAPDQEIWPGEGAFFGLGCQIKFPSDFSRAPYSVFATGIFTLPQKLTYPFSLISPPDAAYPGLSPALNELRPGWVFADNLYMVRRNETKYRKRNRARRSRFEFEVLRPEIVDMVRDALARLSALRAKPFYTDEDEPGFGKNYVTAAGRADGIEAYRLALRLYSLSGLARELEGGRDPEAVLSGPAEGRWAHEREVLREMYPAADVRSLLGEYMGVLEAVGSRVERSKMKDDARGARIIPGYADAHRPAAEDDFVRETWKDVRVRQERVFRMMERLR
ncbi:MAG: DUF4954 family protein [Planctomycetota bacterium]|nr:DUF4954 family protein [Planctomycetota bacterium]